MAKKKVTHKKNISKESEKETTKNNNIAGLPLPTWIIIGILVIGLIVAGVLYLPHYFSPKVDVGSTVQVWYSGELKNGTVFDTNMKEVAEKNGMKKTVFEPLSFKVGAGSMIKGFDLGVRGMRKGETKQIFIPSAEAYGAYVAEEVQSIPKEEKATFPRESIIDKKLLPEDTVIGDVLDNMHPLWKIKVTAINETSATVKPVIREGELYPMQNGALVIEVTTLNETNIVLTQRWNVTEGQQIQTNNGVAKIKATGKDFVTFDYNHPLAGLDLYFTVTIEDIQAP